MTASQDPFFNTSRAHLLREYYSRILAYLTAAAAIAAGTYMQHFS